MIKYLLKKTQDPTIDENTFDHLKALGHGLDVDPGLLAHKRLEHRLVGLAWHS